MDAKTKKILDEVKKEIKPGKEALKEVKDLINNLNESAKKLKIDAKAVLGGSYAKNSFLKGDFDVDVFMKFNLSHKNDNMSEILEKLLKKSKIRGSKIERVHGSRDYFQAKNKVNYEIIPVLDIKSPEDAENVTDFSPWHVEWVKKNIKDLHDDVRLAKKFCKAQKVYGAESYIRGFSGHVLDILIIYYKGFVNMLKGASKWRKKQVIDFYNTHKGKALFNLNVSKTTGPMVIIDPVQPARNAAAAICEEKFEIFKRSAREFLKNPSKDFFVERNVDLDSMKKKAGSKGRLIVVDIRAMKGKEDVIGTKLMKVFELISKELEEFEIKFSGWEWDKDEKAFLWYVLKKKELENIYIHPGPPLEFKKAVAAFKKKHRKTFKKKGRIYAEVKRKHTKPEGLLKEIFNKEYIKTKVKKIKIR